ncbi:MAG: FHA domain-containing protein, partial [Myxococcales bacterium]|nr:FHA domain-containing protein [Myxococcales bacterium]
MSSHYVLKIQYVNKPPETRNIGARVTTIGREAGDIVLGDPQSSGRHAEIHFEDGQVNIKDLGSTNGTFYNGQRNDGFALQPGQGFSIGQTVMTLMAINVPQQRPGAGKTMIAMGGMPPRPPG